MADVVEHVVGDLTLRIDRSVCVGFEYCTDASPTAFRLAGDDVVEFVEPEQESRRRLIVAVSACPVTALSIVDAHGNQLAP
jgi:ferredoxin